MKNEVKARLRSGEIRSGTRIASSSTTAAADLPRNPELYWPLVDTEHSALNAETMSSMVQLTGDPSQTVPTHT